MRIICIIFLLILGGCSAAPPKSLPAVSGWQKLKIPTEIFTLSALFKMPDTSANELTLYIEGDGRAWVSRSTSSADPTPLNPVAKNLALLDNGDAVAYLARPCQYEPRRLDVVCKRAYWTDKRFAPEVIRSINQAITSLKIKAGAQKIHLVGYSGGGGVAALVAAKRDDVASLRTIAANLNTSLFTRHHRVTPMKGSLNPVDVAGLLSGLPQIHYIGADDKVVPPLIANSFIAAQGETSCAHKATIPHVTHGKGWERVWPRLASRMPQCGQ